MGIYCTTQSAAANIWLARANPANGCSLWSILFALCPSSRSSTSFKGLDPFFTLNLVFYSFHLHQLYIESVFFFIYTSSPLARGPQDNFHCCINRWTQAACSVSMFFFAFMSEIRKVVLGNISFGLRWIVLEQWSTNPTFHQRCPPASQLLHTTDTTPPTNATNNTLAIGPLN